jgi:hypothetical protein
LGQEESSVSTFEAIDTHNTIKKELLYLLAAPHPSIFVAEKPLLTPFGICRLVAEA